MNDENNTTRNEEENKRSDEDLTAPESGLGECVICMSSLLYDPHLEQNQVQQFAKIYMLTPCTHRFHKPCLTQWMNNKM